jgi:murein DD-endopeptidase MepM/ murein hydrolase activator NlpD
MLFLSATTPNVAHASILSSLTSKVKAIILNTDDTNDEEEASVSSQTMNVLKPVIVDTEDVTGAVIDSSSSAEALQATSGSLRFSTEDIDFPTTDTISVYEVKNGDTLATVAKLFGVSKNTIIWANDLKSPVLTPGDTLVILPMTGLKHIVKNGDTIASIAKKYKADADDVAKFNGLARDAILTAGTTLLVPEGEIAYSYTTPTKSSSKVRTKILNSYSYTAPEGFLIRPIVGGRKTQGIHGHNGVDLANIPGTPVMAAATGRVIVAKMGGYNGGYGNMVILAHDNNIQTVYAHLRAVYVTTGEVLSQGQVLGELGNSGRSTGPHLHFEVRGAKNPF